jgi:LuxR family transcriptional regulator, maltose regulon positive regulatory protein
VLSRLPQRLRGTLAALVVLGTATAEEASAVGATDAEMEHLAREVPLVDRLDDGRYRVHDLWTSLVLTDHLRDKAV